MPNLANKMNKVGEGYDNEIIIADIDGDAKPSGVKIGSSSISSSPNNNTVATESGIKSYIDENTVTIDKISTSRTVATTEDDASDGKVISEKGLLSLINWNVI